MRIAEYDLDTAMPRAHAHFLRATFVARTPRERRRWRWLTAFDRLGLLLPPHGLAPPDPPADGEIDVEAALDAAGEALARAGDARPIESGLSRSAAAPARRTTFLWRAEPDEADSSGRPFAVAKVHAESSALDEEAATLATLADMAWEVTAAAPRVLARSSEGARGALGALVQTALPGQPLALLHRRSARPGAWDPETFRAVGRWLGRFHLATLRRDAGRGLLVTAVHGGLSSRAILVRDGKVTGVVGWSGWRPEGDPAAEIAEWIVRAAEEDLAGRGPRAASLAADADSLARWLFVPGSPAFAAVRACIGAWKDVLGDVLPSLDLTDILHARVTAALERGRGAVAADESSQVRAFLAGRGGARAARRADALGVKPSEGSAKPHGAPGGRFGERPAEADRPRLPGSSD